MDKFWAFAFLVSVLAFIVGLILMAFKSRRRKGAIVVTVSFVLAIGAALLGSSHDEAEAKRRGFSNATAMRAADKAGVADPQEWAHREAVLKEQEEAKAEADRLATVTAKAAKDAEAKKKAEAERLAEAEKEKKCRVDLSCWGEKFSLQSAIACRPAVEGLASIDFKWTDSLLEPKFSHYRWKSKDKGIVTYIGDKIQLQNGFGAWIRHTYECDFDTNTNSVVGVRASRGKI